QVLGASAAGVMLASANGDLRLVASSSDAMRVVELFELQAREGPCLDAFRTGERVAHENLAAGTGRWPRFATVALEAGFRSVFARAGIDMAEAFSRLRSYARDHNLRLTDVAQSAIEGSLDIGAWAPSPPATPVP